MTKPSAYDTERLKHINNLMDNIYESTTEVYERLVDREFKELEIVLNSLINQLIEVKHSIKDDI